MRKYRVAIIDAACRRARTQLFHKNAAAATCSGLKLMVKYAINVRERTEEHHHRAVIFRRCFSRMECANTATTDSLNPDSHKLCKGCDNFMSKAAHQH